MGTHKYIGTKGRRSALARRAEERKTKNKMVGREVAGKIVKRRADERPPKNRLTGYERRSMRKADKKNNEKATA